MISVFAYFLFGHIILPFRIQGHSMQPNELIKHSEGGWYRQVFKSDLTVTSPDGRNRSALTHIYFELKAGEVSRFHRVASDEIWNLYRGADLNLYTWNGSTIPPIC